MYRIHVNFIHKNLNKFAISMSTNRYSNIFFRVDNYNSLNLSTNGVNILLPEPDKREYNISYSDNDIITRERVKIDINLFKYIIPFKRTITFEYTEKAGIILLIDDKSLFNYHSKISIMEGYEKFVRGFNTKNYVSVSNILHYDASYKVYTKYIDKYRFNKMEINIK